MRVAVAYEAGKPLVLEDLPIPTVGPRDVLVRIAASGICHTDLNVIEGRSALQLPIVPGHEATGLVEQVGAEVRRVRPGDRVLASVSPACGSCWWCVNGMSNHCERGPLVQTAARFALDDGRTARAVCGCGSFAEAMVVDEASVVAVQTDLPDEQLALLGCGVTTGVGAALNTAQVSPGSTVAVIGCGGVGQSVIQGARIAGAAVIIAIDPATSRREAALRVGATHAVDPDEADPVEQVRALTGGRGADYSFEVVGLPDLMTQAYAMARMEGTVTLVGMPAMGASVTLPAIPAVFSGKKLVGSPVGGSQILRDFPRFIRLAEAGRLDLGQMVSRRIKLEDVNEGVELTHAAEGIRTVIV
ncbi:Zn-dependent alcohol dehydrogenase [Frankia sp. AgB1.9]|uniref:Zn-dependent alcohol dehydrogenase n=1 Tax=unclassified Frankia TaxID=2632575 RepID=UPI001933388E|nr:MULTISPECIES: Zn-dependent alcohol dehydrogenase [unclassified Frankia]MBL7488246.1 Zn-dependent alcohol dehydrogenase [Frankia sp. AgW1.1]MBL7548111.1 Zn-dependent alcohol dehydrogenase [Frankia sp. AgB1.9]MBL7620337.1 Zn-dependent alcohol dehydrogenase [Frankia sp. AgB1.8]